MNKKTLFFSMFSISFLLTILSGCDWCSCCKKEACTTQAITATPKTTEEKPSMAQNQAKETAIPMPHPETPAPMPKMAAPMMPHPAMPTPMPVEPKIA